MKNNAQNLEVLPQYVLRIPLMDFAFFKNLTKDVLVKRETLVKVFKNSIIRESIFLASPTFYFELIKWEDGVLNNKKAKRIEISLLKYLTRISTRCTPFGLFAGSSVGEISSFTNISIQPPIKHNRKTRLDMNYLIALSQDIAKIPRIKNKLRFYPNTSIYPIGEKLRYIEYYYKNSERHHHVVEIENSPYLTEVLKKSESGSYLGEIKSVLEQMKVSDEDAENFVNELLESQLLVSNLEPSVTGPDFTAQMISAINEISIEKRESNFIQILQNHLRKIDEKIGNNPNTYLDLKKIIGQKETTFNIKYLFQTDLIVKANKNFLSESIVSEIKKAVVFLNKILPPPVNSRLDMFKEVFSNRYGSQEMPLALVLDIESGIGYRQNNSNIDFNPLVDDLKIQSNVSELNSLSFKWNVYYQILLEKVIDCKKNDLSKIDLKEKDFIQFMDNWQELPDTFSAMIEVHDDEQTNIKIKLSGAGGSSAANLLSRFCHVDAKIDDLCLRINEHENLVNNKSIVAEIVHLPEDRIGNIIARPSSREYEIPYLAKSCKSKEHQIGLNDLYISLKMDKVVLRSASLNKTITPKLTNAHNFSTNSLPVYHFLSDLQTQDTRDRINFNFGPIETFFDFLPRVEFNDIILHESKWFVKFTEIKSLLDVLEDEVLFRQEIEAFRCSKKLPKYVILKEGDNELLVDFGNSSSVRMLLNSIKKNDSFVLKEFLSDYEGVVKSEGGYFSNEIILSFINKQKLNFGERGNKRTA